MSQTGEPRTQHGPSSGAVISQAFWIAFLGLLVVTFLVSWPGLYGNSLGSKVGNLGISGLVFVVGFLIGHRLTSAATAHVHDLEGSSLPPDDQRMARARAGERRRLQYALLLSGYVVLLVALTWVMHDQAWGWAQPVNGTTAVAQVTKVGFALLGAFIGHHMALKGHLAELEALARRLASRADSTEDNEPDSTDLSADDIRSETGD